MLLLDQFKQADLSEKIAALTSTIIVLGLSYKLGYYHSKSLDSLWVIQFFNIFDLAYSALKLLFLYILILILHDKVFSRLNAEKNVWIFSIGLLGLAIYQGYQVFNGIGYLGFFFTLALFLGIFFGFTLYDSRPVVKYTSIVFLTMIIPFLQGISDIQRDIYYADLPKVLLKESKPNEDWRFLDKANEKLILLNQKNPKELKIVGMDEVKKFTNSDIKN